MDAVESAILLIDEGKLSPELSTRLKQSGVLHQPYEAMIDLVRNLKGKIWIDGRTANVALYK